MPYWLKTFSTGYINPLTKGPGITANQSSLIVSILSAGTFFGALTAAPTADFTGRRMALMITLVVSALVFSYRRFRLQSLSSWPVVSLLGLVLG
jgi:MFS family permease